MENKKALVIIAHPDDETIWMGGTIQRQKCHWTIFSLCRASDSDRAPKFKKVCALYNANCIIADLEDEKLAPLSISEISTLIKNNLENKKFDTIFTHGANGEYGHRRHIEIRKSVAQLQKQNVLICRSLYSFAYELSDKLVPCTAMRIATPKKTNTMINLTKKELETKKKIIHEIYGFKKNSFEYLCCNKTESFTKLK